MFGQTSQESDAVARPKPLNVPAGQAMKSHEGGSAPFQPSAQRSEGMFWILFRLTSMLTFWNRARKAGSVPEIRFSPRLIDNSAESSTPARKLSGKEVNWLFSKFIVVKSELF